MKKSSLLALEPPATIRPTLTITNVSSPPSTTRARTNWEYGDHAELKAQGTFVPGAPDWWTGGDLDCADFASQKDAQAFFEAMGGPENDPDSLDEDGDGVVCRSLP